MTATKSGFISPPAVCGLWPSSVRTLRRFAGGMQVEHGQAAVLVEAHQQVGGVVALHACEQRRDLLVGALAQELELVLVVELLEDVGLELLVVPERLEDLLPLLVRGRLDEIGDLRGVKLCEPTVREAQSRGGDVSDERLELRPRNEALVLAFVLAEAPREQAAQPRAKARVDADNAPDAVLASELDLAARRRGARCARRSGCGRGRPSAAAPLRAGARTARG